MSVLDFLWRLCNGTPYHCPRCGDRYSGGTGHICSSSNHSPLEKDE